MQFFSEALQMSRTVFSYPKYNGRHANLGNTVLVNIGQLRNESDLWCLGYLQNIEGEQTLIDLDCAQFPPFWISTQYVWYHHLTDFGPPSKYPLRPPPLLVQVALRSELDGPWVFHPAQLLNRPACENLYICCVTMQETDADVKEDQVVQIVHHWQVVESLPTTEGPLFGRLRETGNLDEIPIMKQIVHTKNVATLQTFTNVPQQRIRALVFVAMNRAGFQRNGQQNGLDPRVCVAIGEKSITFLHFDLHLWSVVDDEVGPREWTDLSAQAFAAGVEEWLGGLYKQETAPEVRICDTSIKSGITGLDGLAKDAESLIHMLPFELLSEVLLSLDFHSQMKAKRVSSIWHSLLRIRSACAVIIDFTSFDQKPHFMDFIDADEGYYFSTLVDRAVSQKTKALGLYNINVDKLFGYDDPCRIMEIIINLLILKKVEPLVIMLKDCRLLFELTLNWKAGDFTIHHLFHISKLLLVCKRVLLTNHTTTDYRGCDCGVIQGRVKRPQYVTVTFPSLEFHRCADERDSLMRYVNALEPQLPSVDTIKARFKERHQFFVETLPYPDGWQQFRQFLRRHTFTELATLDSFWNELDLRNFDQLPLSKMVLLPLDDCVDIVFENVNV